MAGEYKELYGEEHWEWGGVLAKARPLKPGFSRPGVPVTAWAWVFGFKCQGC